MVQHKTHPKPSPITPSLQPNPSVYSQLFSKATDLILVLSLDWHLEYANPAAETFFKLPRAGYRGRSVKGYFAEELLLKFIEASRKVRHDVSQLRFEVDFRGHDNRPVAMELLISPRTDGKVVTGFYLHLRDVSHERQIQELIRESQKMEALQYFISGTTKEIQHPLMAILKKIEGFEGKYAGRSFEYVSYKEFVQIMDFLKVIRGQIKLCYDTTAKLTNINKKRLKFESHHCSCSDVIRELIKVKDANLKNGNVKFRLRLADKLPLIALGEIELNEIVGHIVDNSLQAMPAGGHLAISTALASGGHEVRIDIGDDGVGISPDDLPHIFEPFFTTKQRGFERTIGLGLSIVYSLVKAAHGQIKVKSSLRKGTTVQLTFPVDEQFPKPRHK